MEEFFEGGWYELNYGKDGETFDFCCTDCVIMYLGDITTEEEEDEPSS